MSKPDYENERFELVSGCCIIDKTTFHDVAHVRNGGIEWMPPDDRTQKAVSSFVFECALHGITFGGKQE